MRLAECCAFFPRCAVGERRGHVVGTHDADAAMFIHFDDGEYAVRKRDEVTLLFREEALA